MVITVSGTSGDKINSLWFKKKLGYQYAGNQDYGWGYVFAVKLDTPVTIDSTGTANFTFSVEF